MAERRYDLAPNPLEVSQIAGPEGEGELFCDARSRALHELSYALAGGRQLQHVLASISLAPLAPNETSEHGAPKSTTGEGGVGLGSRKLGLGDAGGRHLRLTG